MQKKLAMCRRHKNILYRQHFDFIEPFRSGFVLPKLSLPTSCWSKSIFKHITHNALCFVSLEAKRFSNNARLLIYSFHKHLRIHISVVILFPINSLNPPGSNCLRSTALKPLFILEKIVKLHSFTHRNDYPPPLKPQQDISLKLMPRSLNILISIVAVFIGLGLFLRRTGRKSYTFIHCLLLLTKIRGSESFKLC